MKLNLPYFGPVTVEVPYLAGGLAGTLVVLGGLGYWMWGTGPTTIASSDTGGTCTAKETFNVTDADFTRGSSTAPITVVEYASMTCPHCARFNNNVLPHLEADYVDKGHVRYVFREFPLDSVAMTISVIGRCLPKDQYLPFVDLMYRTQDQWAMVSSAEELRGSIKEMARRAGMSGDRFEECLAKSEPDAKKIDAIRAEGIKDYCVGGTPTIFMNGKVIASGEISYPDLDQKVRTELTRLGKTPPPKSPAASGSATATPAPTEGAPPPDGTTPTEGAAPPADGAAAPAGDGAGSPIEEGPAATSAAPPPPPPAPAAAPPPASEAPADAAPAPREPPN